MGVYVAVNYTNGTTNKIHELFDGVPNLVPKDKIHTTVIYSRTGDFNNVDISQYDDISKAYCFCYGLDVWKTQDGKNALVMKIPNAMHLIEAHRQLMKKYDLSYDFPEYQPHITISYDVGDNFNIDEYSKKVFTLILFYDKMYKEELIENWQNK